jgi:hypothetical protein
VRTILIAADSSSFGRELMNSVEIIYFSISVCLVVTGVNYDVHTLRLQGKGPFLSNSSPL